MSTRTILVGATIIIAVIGTFIYLNNIKAPEIINNTNPETDDVASGMRAEENMVVVMEQGSGNTVIGSIIFLAAPGYLVVHEDVEGSPGAILGSSARLPAGENTDVKVMLSRASRNGETLHAMLHFEKGGNATFTAAEDTPVPSILGSAIHGTFEVSDDAPSDIPVSI